MNGQHLQAFLWLRWRILVNQWRRGGSLNATLMTILAVGALLLAVPLGIGSFVLGVYLIPKATPLVLLGVWDGVIVAFVFFWMVGLLTELQRTETLALSKFLHLPVSIKEAFLINYVSSLLRLSLIVFVPVMLGFSLALIFTRGILLLFSLPLLAAFLLMVTALTYQFQGWLASLMSNPRRRRTVIVVVTGMFVLIVQTPNLLNLVIPWRANLKNEAATQFKDELAKLRRDFQAHDFDVAEHLRRQNEVIENFKLAKEREDEKLLQSLDQVARTVNAVLPIGWLPIGVVGAVEGHVFPAVLGFFGMALIGTVSLWRAYGTTLRLYQGDFTSRKGSPAPPAAAPARTRKPGTLLLDTRLPGLSEPVSAIMLGSLRGLLRSPEAKMMLLSALVLGTIFGSMMMTGPKNLPDALRPLMAMGGMFMVLFGLAQIMANQFGFDRDGFRVYVLCAVPRRDILLGKNLAFAPLALGFATLLLIIVQVVFPLRLDHFLAMLAQYVSMFLLFCLMTNMSSIYAPMHIAAGSLQPAHPKLRTILLQMAMFGILLPLTQVPTLLPLGIEFALNYFGWNAGVPICLILSLAECAAVIAIYRITLKWQGDLLQAREQKILESVTNLAP